MHPPHKPPKTMPGARVYEYVADDGTVFFSFDKAPSTISKPKRLILKNRRGTHFIPFLALLRRRADALGIVQPEEEEG